MAESTKHKNMRDGILDIIAGAETYRIKYEQGTLNVTIPGPTVANYLDRGQFNETPGDPPALRFDQDQPCTGSFSAYFRDLSDAAYVTLPEFLVNSGLFDSAWASTLGSNEEVKTVDLKWTIAGTIHGDSADHTALWKYCRLTGSFAEGSPTLSTVNFTSYILYPTVT